MYLDRLEVHTKGAEEILKYEAKFAAGYVTQGIMREMVSIFTSEEKVDKMGLRLVDGSFEKRAGSCIRLGFHMMATTAWEFFTCSTMLGVIPALPVSQIYIIGLF